MTSDTTKTLSTRKKQNKTGRTFQTSRFDHAQVTCKREDEANKFDSRGSLLFIELVATNKQTNRLAKQLPRNEIRILALAIVEAFDVLYSLSHESESNVL